MDNTKATENALRERILNKLNPPEQIYFNEIYSSYLINKPSFIDVRHIKCACDNPECKIGLNFAPEANIMRLTDKNGNETNMILSEETANDLIETLQKDFTFTND